MAALSAGKPRPKPVTTADLVERARAEAQTVGSAFCDTLTERLLTALAKALEDTAAERDRAHATLRGIEAQTGERWVARLARDRLENP